MASFCRQCSLELFQEDFHDYPVDEIPDDHCMDVLCEECGPIQVNNKGECISDDCLKAKSGQPHHAEADAEWRK